MNISNRTQLPLICNNSLTGVERLRICSSSVQVHFQKEVGEQLPNYPSFCFKKIKVKLKKILKLLKNILKIQDPLFEKFENLGNWGNYSPTSFCI
jgi:hypothetical protein